MDAKARRLVAVFGCLVAACNLTQPPPSVQPTSVASTPPASAPTTRRFEASGVSFDYPAEWVDQSELVPEDPRPGRRHIATLTLGMSVCPRDKETPWSEQGPASCSVEPQLPGDLRFDVSELMDLYPGTRLHAGDMWLGGGVLNQQWSVETAEGGELWLLLRTRSETFPDRASSFQVRMREVIATVTTTPWQSPPPADNGVVTESMPQGFLFRYPAGWARYYPVTTDRYDRTFVSISSRPLEKAAACPSGRSCQDFSMPANTAVIEFGRDGGPGFVDWEYVWDRATETLGGQPATTRTTLDLKPFSTADELITWRVRLSAEDQLDPLTIQTWLRGPDIEAARAAARAIIDSVEITGIQGP